MVELQIYNLENDFKKYIVEERSMKITIVNYN